MLRSLNFLLIYMIRDGSFLPPVHFCHHMSNSSIEPLSSAYGREKLYRKLCIRILCIVASLQSEILILCILPLCNPALSILLLNISSHFASPHYACPHYACLHYACLHYAFLHCAICILHYI